MMQPEIECWLAEEQAWVDRWIDQPYVDMAILGYLPDGPNLQRTDDDNIRTELQPRHFAAEVASKRAILELHEESEGGECSTCVRVVDGTPQRVRWPCETIRALTIPLISRDSAQPV